MVVRGGTLTTEGIWDDTDIVHVVYSEIVVPNLDTYGGLRLESSTTASLVVKLNGANAGFTATGTLLEITDRVGGTVQVIGQPGHPVVLTSLSDDTVGAGFDPNGNPMVDTDNTPNSTGTPGDWQGVELDQYSNDRNVAVAVETEPATGASQDSNGTINTAQPLGRIGQQRRCGRRRVAAGIRGPRHHRLRPAQRRRRVQLPGICRHGGLDCHRPHELLARFRGRVDRRRRERVGPVRQLAGRDEHPDHAGQFRLDVSGRVQHQPARRGAAHRVARPRGPAADLLHPRQQRRRLPGAEQTSGEYQLQVRLQPVY